MEVKVLGYTTVAKPGLWLDKPAGQEVFEVRGRVTRKPAEEESQFQPWMRLMRIRTKGRRVGPDIEIRCMRLASRVPLLAGPSNRKTNHPETWLSRCPMMKTHPRYSNSANHQKIHSPPSYLEKRMSMPEMIGRRLQNRTLRLYLPPCLWPTLNRQSTIPSGGTYI